MKKLGELIAEYDSILENQLMEDIVKIPHFKHMPPEKLRGVFKQNDLMKKIIASKYVSSAGNKHRFRLATSNDDNSMFATYDIYVTWSVNNSDLSATIDAEPIDVRRKEKTLNGKEAG